MGWGGCEKRGRRGFAHVILFKFPWDTENGATVFCPVLGKYAHFMNKWDTDYCGYEVQGVRKCLWYDCEIRRLCKLCRDELFTLKYVEDKERKIYMYCSW